MTQLISEPEGRDMSDYAGCNAIHGNAGCKKTNHQSHRLRPIDKPAQLLRLMFRILLSPVIVVLPLGVSHAARSADNMKAVKVETKVIIRRGIVVSEARAAAVSTRTKDSHVERQISKRPCPDEPQTYTNNNKSRSNIGCTLVIVDHY